MDSILVNYIIFSERKLSFYKSKNKRSIQPWMETKYFSRFRNVLKRSTVKCIGLQKMEDSPMDDNREIVLLKNRFTGEVGNADTLQYNRNTGRLIEADSRF